MNKKKIYKSLLILFVIFITALFYFNFDKIKAFAASLVVNLSASSTSVNLGGSSTINWSSSGADNCSFSGGGYSSTATSGSKLFTNSTVPTTFSLTCTSSSGYCAGTVAGSICDGVADGPYEGMDCVIFDQSSCPGTVDPWCHHGCHWVNP